MTPPLRTTIARFVHGHHDTSPELRSWMLTLLRDYWAVTEAGSALPSTAAARQAISTREIPDDQHTSMLIGSGLWARADDAALVNGVSGHGLELDDTYEPSSLHPGVVVFSSVLALASERGLSWEEALPAVIVGYEVMCQVGVYVGSAETYSRSFHPTAVSGAWGAAAACARLIGLDSSLTEEALALAANMAAGSLEFLGDGSWTKRLNAGHAASLGIRAVKLAEAGFTGPALALEGRHGFATQYGHGVQEGRELALAYGQSARDTSIKLFPCCRYMHGGMDLLAQYRAENPGLDLESIERIEVGVITAGRTLVSDPAESKRRIRTSVDAQFSMPFGAAVALAHDLVGPEIFDNAADVATELQHVIDKVVCVSTDALDSVYPERWAADTTITFRDGTIVELSEPSFIGSPANPASPERLASKVEALVGAERTLNITEATQSLENSMAVLAWCEKLAH
jgi:2-methylcitrate dehydratase PrpD